MAAHRLWIVAALTCVALSASAENWRDEYGEGTRQFDVGDYRAALESFKRAYLVHDEAGILFDIGECHRMLGENKEAVFSYRSYLRRKPDAANRAAVEAVIAKLEGAAAPPSAPASVVASSPAASAPTLPASVATPPTSTPTPRSSAPTPSLSAAAPVATPRVTSLPPAWLNGATTTQFERVRLARKLRNRGRAALVVGGIFGAVATALTSIAIWQYQARNGGDSAADGHILGPALPGVGLGLIAAPLLIVGPSTYVKGLHAVRDAEEEAGIAPR